MGESVANAGIATHATGSPITVTLEFYLHWGDESLDHKTTVTNTQALALQVAAAISQSAFDTAAAIVASWYGLTGLNSTKRAAARERLWEGVKRVSSIPQP